MEKTDEVLASFCAYLVCEHPEVKSFADVVRPQAEAYKAHLSARLTPWARRSSPIPAGSTSP